MEAIGPVFETVKYLWVPFVRQIGYVKNLKNNFEKLNKEVQDLYNKRDDLVINTRRPGKVPTRELQGWLKDVEEIEKKMRETEVEYNQERKCFIGWCPDIFSCRKLGKHMVKLINNISDLKRKEFEHGGIVDEPPPGVVVLPGPGIESGTSAGRTLQKVMECITNAGILKIGIYGMGGVGKTTLMKNLNNQSDIAQMFEYVIWVTVSQTWSIRKVQNEVAQRLSLNDLTNDMSDEVVSGRLCHILKNTKYLLLLDDVWDKVNLEEVGIPTPNVENGCKIVLTTRYLQVCHKMETNKEITVEVLSEEEAWKLFYEKVGSVIDSPKIQQLATSVVKECGGLPLAIIVVGAALRMEDDFRVWKNALKELRSAATSQIEDMEEVVFKRLKFSYDRLKGERQRCFLYGALYPEDHKIVAEELIRYWWVAGLIDGVESLSEALDGGHVILKDLVHASLLEKCEGKDKRKEYVKMHDVIRDLALRITSVKGGGNNKLLVRAGIGIKDPPRDEEWKECNAVSLMYNDLEWLPERAVCPILSTLLLQYNRNLAAIPESFFESMHALQVLDLSDTKIASLPSSIRNLAHLRGLYLNYCECLVELPSEIGALGGLEVLHVKNCRLFEELPIEMGGLNRLKCLHVSFHRRPNRRPSESTDLRRSNKMIPQGIISKLSLLEDLSIVPHREVYNQWDMNLEYVIKEVGNLKKLAHLELLFTRVEYLELFIDMSEPWKNEILSSFHFIVDPQYRGKFYFPEKLVRRLEFNKGDNIPQVIRQVLHRVEGFHIRNHRTIKKLGEFGVENMTQLTYLFVKGCHEMESSLIDRDCSLPFLEDLLVSYMQNLRNIWEEDQGQAPVNLRVLYLHSCNRLKKVLPQSIIQQLPNLEHIQVRNCAGMEEIIEGDDVEYNALPKLKRLSLQDLPNLSSISKKVLAWPSIEEIDISLCIDLKRLPFGIHNTSTLKKIICRKAWWESLQWEDDEIKTQLQPLIHLS